MLSHLRGASFALAVSVAASLATVSACTSLGSSAEGTQTAADIIEAATPAVVKITRFDSAGTEAGTGTGFFIRLDREREGLGVLRGLFSPSAEATIEAVERPAVLLVTNYHVLKGAFSATAELPNLIR